jgi:uncharacterized Zn-binding protein involved in type VI secretion
MPFPASRVGDMHVCPMMTALVPHVGGPVLPPGALTVLIAAMPAATLGTMATCMGPPDAIIMGNMTVLAMKKPIAHMSSSCMHGGIVILGCPTVIV